MAWKHTTYFINNSDPGHKHLKQQLEKNLKISVANPSKNDNEKEKTRSLWRLKGLHAERPPTN